MITSQQMLRGTSAWDAEMFLFLFHHLEQGSKSLVALFELTNPNAKLSILLHIVIGQLDNPTEFFRTLI